MNKILIPMIEYVLEAWKFVVNSKDACEHNTTQLRKIIDYATFLKQPLKLEMFIPVDDGNVLEEFNASKHGLIGGEYYNQYNKALSKVLFKGFEVKYHNCKEFKYQSEKIVFMLSYGVYIEYNCYWKNFKLFKDERFDEYKELTEIEDLTHLNLELK